MNTIMEDGREIESIVMADNDESYYKVGVSKIKAIRPYVENGQMSPVVWFSDY